MAILIGMDEAGYGPNLGPLVIAATVWEVPDELVQRDLYEVLAAVISCRGDGSGRLPIADSKLLYKPGGGLAPLERAVLASLGTNGNTIHSWQEVWRLLTPASFGALADIPWYAAFDRPAPIDGDATQILDDAERLLAALTPCGMRLLEVVATAVFPQRFNALVERFGTKGGMLSNQTIELAGYCLERNVSPLTRVQCDKHGGRNRYGALLQTAFPDYLVEVHGESGAESVYWWGPTDRRVEMRFTVRGENFLPTALASMTAKYLRELAMLAFNDFWCREVPNLRPTAGYPVDAKRFRQQIAARQRELGISEDVLWRCR